MEHFPVSENPLSSDKLDSDFDSDFDGDAYEIWQVRAGRLCSGQGI